MNQFRPTARVRRWLAGLAVLALVGAIGLVPAASVAAAEPDNMVLVWNENAVNVISQPATVTPPGLGQGPPLAALHVAMVHGAIYDAVNAIDGGHEPYLRGLSAPSTHRRRPPSRRPGTTSCTASLRRRIPRSGTGSTPCSTASLALIDAGQAKTDGIEIGADAAAAMLAARANDGRFDVEPFDTSNDVGKWRLVPPASTRTCRASSRRSRRSP